MKLHLKTHILEIFHFFDENELIAHCVDSLSMMKEFIQNTTLPNENIQKNKIILNETENSQVLNDYKYGLYQCNNETALYYQGKLVN
ncbi:hypothetical protein A3Q56_08036 [Intoshia linei]|uniref:Uncharacterized protein n=1 Tax=Intoshia linei TaxID=1819745 RepID=A0A177AR17_9BILA|nr:hypothetical protein A3Q56_08036 [Intoshia linei]